MSDRNNDGELSADKYRVGLDCGFVQGRVKVLCCAFLQYKSALNAMGNVENTLCVCVQNDGIVFCKFAIIVIRYYCRIYIYERQRRRVARSILSTGFTTFGLGCQKTIPENYDRSVL